MADEDYNESSTTSSPEVRSTQLKTQKLKIPLVRADLMVLTGDLSGRRFSVDTDKVIIGRDPSAQLQLPGSDVSRRHASIGQTAGGAFVIEDLKSRNGTLVNGVPIEVHALKFGDKIQIGSRTLLVFTHHQALEEQLVQWQRIELISQMTAGLVHDFNNYMTALLGYIQYLQELNSRETPEGELREMLTSCLPAMESAGREGFNLARRVLTLARGSKRNDAPMELATVVDEAINLVQRSLPANIQVRKELGAGLRIIGDRTEMLQVLINLLLNARDAMPDGGTLTVTGRRRQTEGDQAIALRANDTVELKVQDTGVGMSERTRRRAFEPMFTTKAEGKGTGLGLSMVSRIVEAHGGQVSVDSVLGEGTTFTLEIPYAESKSRPLVVTPSGQTGDLSRDAQAARAATAVAVVVETDVRLRRDATHALCDLGLEVMIAADTDQVAQLLRDHGSAIQLAVLPPLLAQDPVVTRSLAEISPPVRVVHLATSDGVDPSSPGEDCTPVLPTDATGLREGLLHALGRTLT